MIRLFKSLLSPGPLPSHVHFHVDDRGNKVWCDESACRPERYPPSPPLPTRW
jgi:hypothetical protein